LLKPSYQFWFISIAVNTNVIQKYMFEPQTETTFLWQPFHPHVGKPDVTPASSDLFSLHVASWPPSPFAALPLLDHYKT
jgi:hypothetical protein